MNPEPITRQSPDRPIPYRLTDAAEQVLADGGPGSAGPAVRPVQVRLIGEDAAVRALVAALARAACCGPASYRPARHSAGTRAYLTIVVPAEEART